MKPILAIFKKDILSFLTSSMFYTLLGLCCVLWGLFFSFEVYGFVNQSFSYSTQMKEAGINIHHHLIANYIVVVHYILIFILSALSLRFFTEEKKMNTLQLLLSSPISSLQIVVGKWLVGASLIAIILGVSALLPLSLLLYISIPLKLFFLSYIGVFVILCVYMSVGLLASSLTDSLIVCVVLTLVMSILILTLGVGKEFTDIVILKDFFNYLSFDQHFTFFRKGVFNIGSFVYFFSWIFLLGLTTERVIEFHRWR
jgi:ABC-2 type transport system permease protein